MPNDAHIQPGGQTPWQSYAEYFKRFEEKYGDLPIEKIYSAIQKTSAFESMATANPFIQNNRVKRISSIPLSGKKDEIADLIGNVDGNERPLRSVANQLEYASYTLTKIRTIYQSLPTYRYYVQPEYMEDSSSYGSKDFMREWRLLEKINREMHPEQVCRQIVGQCIRDGKVFYYPRIDIDKSHNKCYSAFAQQLPQDWVKIVGFNNKSKYTVAFNMFYFLQPGTQWQQFGDLFKPYIEDFNAFAAPDDKKTGKRKRGTVYAAYEPSYEKLNELKRRMNEGNIPGNPDVYTQNGTWFYWVTLPVDKVFCFEADDVKLNVVSPLTGLFMSISQQAQMENVQLEIVTNPLVAMVLGQMETYDTQQAMQSDTYKVSPSGRELFVSLFQQMLSASNTGGIGFFPAPFKDMKLVNLPESPNANNITNSWQEYLVNKSGLSGILPSGSDARSGIAEISLRIESQLGKLFYAQFANMMNVLYSNMNLQYEWRFVMFGSISEDEKMRTEMLKNMELGILPSVFTFNALYGRSVLDDVAMSETVDKIGLLDKRKPLTTSYSAKQESSELPPHSQPSVTERGGGRPSSDGVTSDGNENDKDM